MRLHFFLLIIITNTDLGDKINEISEQLSETELSDTSSGTTSYDDGHASSSTNDIQQEDRQQNNHSHSRNHNPTMIKSEVNDLQSSALELISEVKFRITEID